MIYYIRGHFLKLGLKAIKRAWRELRLGNDVRRRLFAWEEELESERFMLLLPFVLQSAVNGRWIWQFHATLRYKVSSAYNYLTSRDRPLNNDHTTIIWYKEVPLKVSIFVWRLLRISRRVFNQIWFLARVVAVLKWILTIFLTCDFYRQIWYEIYNWLDLVSVEPALVKDDIILFCSPGGF
jgi:hypothetical protein